MILLLGAALAAEPSLEASVGTTAPVSFAIGVDLDLAHLHSAARVGFMPEAYADAINAVVVGLGGWNEPTAQLIDDVLGPSVAFDLEVGAGLRDQRFYGAAGLSVVTLGGGLTGAEVVEAATGTAIEAPEGPFGRVDEVELSAKTTLYSLKVLVGTRVPLPDPFVLRFELGGLHTIAASSSLKANDVVFEEGSEALDAFLDDIYTRYVWSPLLGVRVGWVF